MVVQEDFEGEKSYRCEECGFHFKDRERAVDCEAFCREKNMCNNEITKHALERQ